MARAVENERRLSHWVSRLVICGAVALSLGTLFLQPSTPVEWVLDVLARTHLVFLGTVMAHEASHGHLGRGRAASFWWGRLALLPAMVPYVSFRKTHPLHHAHTNDPRLDPDYFVRPRRTWEIPLRAMAMPHHWVFWLRARGRIRRRDAVELAISYGSILAVFGTIAALVGPVRVVAAMAPTLTLVSCLLWYPFAIKTHEGWSTGRQETRSHNYYGRVLFWFSLGLSLHRAHHLRPALSWLELRRHVAGAPAGREGWRALIPRRDVRAT